MLGLVTSGCLEEDDTVSAVSVSISDPDASQIDTTDPKMTIAGTAGGKAAIESVSWANDLGGSGMASGTDTWQISDIPLGLGNNTITVSATTSDGESSSDSLVINRESNGTGATTLSWNAPTQRTDGSPLTDLAGYRIHYGRMPETYDYEIEIRNPGVVTYMIEQLVPGEWYFAVSAVDAGGKESDYSNEVTRKVL